MLLQMHTCYYYQHPRTIYGFESMVRLMHTGRALVTNRLLETATIVIMK